MNERIAEADRHRRKIQAIANSHRANGREVSPADVELAIDLSSAWRQAATDRGIDDYDLRGRTDLDHDALDVVVASTLRRRAIEPDRPTHEPPGR